MNVPAGWYSDPQRAGHTRYWDGLRWGITDQQYNEQRAAPRASEPASTLTSEPELTSAPPQPLELGGGMRRLQCDLCNATEFTKEDDCFVCDYCRTKYSTETARRMMIQGTVEVAGTVQVNRASEAANLVLLSMTALEHDNAEESYDYANRALAIDATSWEAWRCKGAAATALATFEDLRASELLGSVDTALRFAPQDRRDELRREWAEELRERGVELYGASVGQLKKFSWTGEPEWSRHVDRSLDVLRVLDKSYTWNARPEALRDSIRVAVHLLEGFRFKDVDGHWDAANLTPQLEQAMQSVLAEKSSELQRFDPSYVPPRPKRARWLSLRRNASFD